RAEPDVAGDAAAPSRFGSADPHRQARNRVVPEFRLLAHSPQPVVPRPDAGIGAAQQSLVRHPKHPSVHAPRLRLVVRRDRCPYRAQPDARSAWSPVHAQPARRARQYPGRAGGVRAVRQDARSAALSRGRPMLIAQISDTHILAPGKLYRGPVQAPDGERATGEFDTAGCLSRAVAALNALVPRPDVVVVTGDLVDHSEPEEYEHFFALLAPLQMPFFVIAGNHDAREPLRE